MKISTAQKRWGVRERDSQQSKVYRAERSVNDQHLTPPTFTTMKECERFAKKVWRSKRVQQAFPRATRNELPDLHDGRGCRSAIASGGWEVKLPKWARRETVILHELAHIIVHREIGMSVAGHGWQFCQTFLKLTLYIQGREAHDELKAAFKRFKVRYTEPRKRKPLTAEQRAVLAARLATARAAKAAAIAAD